MFHEADDVLRLQQQPSTITLSLDALSTCSSHQQHSFQNPESRAYIYATSSLRQLGLHTQLYHFIAIGETMARTHPRARASPYPPLAFHLIRSCLLVCALIVSGILSFFVYHLEHDNFKLPWTFLVVGVSQSAPEERRLRSLTDYRDSSLVLPSSRSSS